MTNYDLIIIGFGKGGKTLASFAANKGKCVAMVEQSEKMYGGTCINIGCIPSKTLIHDAKLEHPFKEAIKRKTEVVDALNEKNFKNLDDESNVDVLNYKARFKDDHTVELLDVDDAVKETISSETIVINTGASPIMPDIDGIDSKFVYDSTGIMELDELPKRLVIVGGGYISLEFASMFSDFGSVVTVLEKHEGLMPKEDKEIVEEVVADLKDKGINIQLETETEAIVEAGDHAVVKTSTGEYEADAVLMAIGRKPNTDLNLEATSIEVGEDGEITVDENLKTTADNVYAIGDVKGGMQFTYISLDDFRIVKSQLFGDGQRTTMNRGEVPYTVFIDPHLSRVGLTAEAAVEDGKNILEGKLEVANIPRHKVNNDPRGLFKVVIDKDTEKILGATLYGKQSEELINIVKLAMDCDLPFTVLRDQIYTHPTMAESFNDLFQV